MAFRTAPTPSFPEASYAQQPDYAARYRAEAESGGVLPLLDAAFRQENDVLAVAEWLRRPAFSPEPGFNALEKARASKWGKEFLPQLLSARSTGEFDYISGRIEQEQKDKMLLGQAGVSGFLTSMAAGVLSPTSLIPAMGPARGLKGAAQAFGLAAAAVTAQEATLYATQETRTGLEVGAGIAAGTVLGGLLGTAARHMTPAGGRLRGDRATTILTREEREAAEAGLRKAARNETSIRLPDGKELPIYATIQEELVRRMDELDNLLPESLRSPFRDYIGVDVGQTSGGGIMTSHALEKIARGEDLEALQSLENIVQPFRTWLRQQVGDTIPLWRYQQSLPPGRTPGGSSPAGERALLSWSSDEEIPFVWGGGKNRQYPTLSEEKILAAQKTYDATGEVTVGGERFVNEDGYVNIYKGEEYITGLGNSPEELSQWLRSRNEEIAQAQKTLDGKNASVRERIVRADVPIEDIFFATNRAGQMEFIVRNTPGSRHYIDPEGNWADAMDEAGMALNRGHTAIPAEGRSLSAAEVNPRNTRGLRTPRNALARGAFNFLGKMNPVTRLYSQTFSPSARYWISRIANPGLAMADGHLNAEDGTILSRRQIHQSRLAEYIVQFEDSYWRHLYGDHDAPIEQKVDIFARLKMGTLGVPEGKMSYPEFGEAVFDTLNTGKPHAEGAVNSAAAELDKFYGYYRGLAKQYAEYRSDLLGEDVPPLFDEDDLFLGQGVENYVTHAFDKNYIVRNAGSFLEDFSRQGEYLYRERFTRSFEKYRNRREQLVRLQDISKMGPEDIQREMDNVNLQLEGIVTDPTYHAGHTELANIRQAERARQMAEGGVDEKALSRYMREQMKASPPEWLAMEKARKGLVRLQSYLKQRGASAGEMREKLTARVLDVQRQQDEAFQKIAEATRVWQGKSARLGKVISGEQVRKAITSLDEQLSALQKLDAKIDKMVAEDGTKADGLRGWKIATQQGKKLAKIASLRERLAAAEAGQLDAGARDLVLEEAHRYAISRAREANYTRALREKNFLDELEELSDEAIARRQAMDEATLSRELETLDDSFDTRWREEGAEGELLNGNADFRAAAIEDANELYRRLTGAPDRAVGMDLVGAKRGPQLRRVLSMPYKVKRKYLIRDPEQVVRRYGRAMDSDLELWRATGSVNGSTIFDEIKADFSKQRERFSAATHIMPKQAERIKWMTAAMLKASAKAPVLFDAKSYVPEGTFFSGVDVPEGAIPLTPQMKEAYSTILSAQEKQVAKDMSVVIDRLRHDRGYPADANATGYRLGRFALNAQVAMMMGKVTVSSLSDVVRPVAKYGTFKTIEKGWVPFITNAKFRGALMQSDRRKAIGLDPLLHNRAQAFADIYNQAPVYGHKGVATLEKGMEVAAQKIGLIALFDYWTAMNKHVASSVTQVEMADNIAVLMGRVPSNAKEMDWAKANLQRLGLSEGMARRIDAQMNLPDGSTDLGEGMRLPNTDAWDDVEAYQAYNSIVLNEVDNLIITPGLDLPTVFDENMGMRLFFQFKSFTFASTTRVLMSGLQGNDPFMAQYALGSLAFGALSYYTWAATASGDNWKKAQDADAPTVLYEALDRSGLLGAGSLLTKVGEQVPGLSDYWIFGGEERTTRRGGDLISAIAGPTASTVAKLGQIATEVDDPTASTVNKIRTLLPYNNVFYLDRLLDGLQGWTVDALNIPENRKGR